MVIFNLTGKKNNNNNNNITLHWPKRSTEYLSLVTDPEKLIIIFLNLHSGALPISHFSHSNIKCIYFFKKKAEEKKKIQKKNRK